MKFHEVANISARTELESFIPPLSQIELGWLEENCLGFQGFSKDGREGLSLIPSYLGNLWWYFSIITMPEKTEDYTPRPLALSALARSFIVEPVKSGQIVLHAERREPGGPTYFDQCSQKQKPSDTLYFIEAIGTPFVKIGVCTGSAELRITQLQTGSPFELRLVASRRGSAQDERNIHRRLKDSRIRGEWFEWTDELKVIIRETQS